MAPAIKELERANRPQASPRRQSGVALEFRQHRDRDGSRRQPAEHMPRRSESGVRHKPGREPKPVDRGDRHHGEEEGDLRRQQPAIVGADQRWNAADELESVDQARDQKCADSYNAEGREAKRRSPPLRPGPTNHRRLTYAASAPGYLTAPVTCPVIASLPVDLPFYSATIGASVSICPGSVQGGCSGDKN